MRNEGTVMNEPQTSEKTFSPRPTYNLYHAKNDGKGNASRWEYEPNKGVIFLSLAHQTGKNENGNGTFGWRKWDKDTKSWGEHSSVSMALGVSDISEILQVLYGRKAKAGTDKGVYHQFGDNTSTLNFSVYEDNGKFVCYNLQVSNKNKNDKDAYVVKHSIFANEAEVLRIHLEEALKKMLNW